ncbi:MAG: hypothetical protein AAF288_07135 [Planctomycetota bacterium]
MRRPIAEPDPRADRPDWLALIRSADRGGLSADWGAHIERLASAAAALHVAQEKDTPPRRFEVGAHGSSPEAQAPRSSGGAAVTEHD